MSATWQPDGVDFAVFAYPRGEDEDPNVSFGYWNVSPDVARGVARALLAAADHAECGGNNV